MLRAAGVERVVLVTSAAHMPRSRWCFEQNGIEVIAAPVGFLAGTTRVRSMAGCRNPGILAERPAAQRSGGDGGVPAGLSLGERMSGMLFPVAGTQSVPMRTCV